MVKWLSERTVANGENLNGVTYSTFEEDDKRFEANDDKNKSVSGYSGRV